MAEQSVQGRIHSVFQKSSPTDSLAPKLVTKKNGSPKAPVFDTTCKNRPSAPGQRLLRRVELHLLNGNNRLSPVTNPQLTEHRGDVGLDGCFRHIQIISNLFVQQP